MELQIGITDLCNYSCVMCMQQAHKGLYGAKDRIIPVLHKGNRGFISKQIFKKILNETDNINFDILKMQWNGESFIHPGISGLIDILSTYSNFKRIVFTTNVSVMNSNIINSLKKIKTHIQFVLSLDSFNPQIYKNIKGVDNIYKVEKNIEYLRQELPSAVFTFQAIAMDENFYDIYDFTERCKKKYNVKKIIFDEAEIYKTELDCIFIKKLGAYEQKKYDKIHKKIFYDIIKDKDYTITGWDGTGKRPPCPGPFRTPLFNWDGGMTYCCMDSELELSPGSIEDKSFEELWNSDMSQNLRNCHLNEKADNFARCRRCQNLNIDGLKKNEMEGL